MAREMSAEIIGLYARLLEAWNRRDAAAYGTLFTATGHVTGFDGSQMNGPDEIAAEVGAIFAHHPTAVYVAKVREVRPLAEDVTLLRAAVGMVPPGQDALNPAANAIQSLVVVTEPADGMPRIAFFQNTPAAFHGRPHLVDALTEELEGVLRGGQLVAVD
jgi:uncharacterized protein (TIGR02246 family)